ncbi:hypothetical protein K0M31_018111 [Melipona bicolor]|uniref:Uncharacterized protein n=1 Tax=Melipona bicolor TaxID=60889 RepID=A0AA40FCY6_9HYME|nr:hypothetical protein K0M31_018111 [Melipona bicolor]
MLNLTDIRVKFNTSRERQSLLLSLLMSRTPTRHEGSLFPEGAAGTRGVPTQCLFLVFYLLFQFNRLKIRPTKIFRENVSLSRSYQACDESSTHVHEVVSCVVKNTLTRRFHWTNENQPVQIFFWLTMNN